MTALPAYADLQRWAPSSATWSWLRPLLAESERLLAGRRHGDLPRWREALAQLPEPRPFFDGRHAAPRLGRPVADRDALAGVLQRLHPWRKGPLRIGGVDIDAEWRSELKWARLAGDVDLAGHRVLDVGSGNGYFGWRMLGAGAERVIGVDPTLLFVMQWLAARHFAGAAPHHILPLGAERLPWGARCFDSVFSMGVLYHRREPVRHLARLAGLARPGGQLVLETLVLEHPGDEVLEPRGRYARMRNVRAIPTLRRLRRWLSDAGLRRIELLDVSATTSAEQRSTPWMRFESLDRCLDPEDPARTVEGHPAPVRAMLKIAAPG